MDEGKVKVSIRYSEDCLIDGNIGPGIVAQFAGTQDNMARIRNALDEGGAGMRKTGSNGSGTEQFGYFDTADRLVGFLKGQTTLTFEPSIRQIGMDARQLVQENTKKVT